MALRRSEWLMLVGVFGGLAGLACSKLPTEPDQPFELVSSSFLSGAAMPLKHACIQLGGQNLSPQLAWRAPPDHVARYAIVMDGEAPPCGTGANACRHWMVYNIPASVTSLAEGQTVTSIANVVEGIAYTGNSRYEGPCPSEASFYTFTVYALRQAMPMVPAGTALTRSEFEATYATYILEKAELGGLFSP